MIITSGDKNHLCGASLCNSDIRLLWKFKGLVPQTTCMSASSFVPSCMSSSNSISLRSHHESERLLAVQWCYINCMTHYVGFSLHAMIMILSWIQVPIARLATSDVNCGSEPCQCGPALTFQFHAFAGYLSTRVAVIFQIACSAVNVYVHDDHYLMCSKFNSLLTEMITPQTYIKITSWLPNHKKNQPTDEIIMMKPETYKIWYNCCEDCFKCLKVLCHNVVS